MNVSPQKKSLSKKIKDNLRFSKNAVIVLGIFALYCFVNVWQNVSITYLNRQNEDLRHDLKSLERECDMLTLELEELKDPERIRRVLSEKMKIVPAEKINIHKVH